MMNFLKKIDDVVVDGICSTLKSVTRLLMKLLVISTKQSKIISLFIPESLQLNSSKVK